MYIVLAGSLLSVTVTEAVSPSLTVALETLKVGGGPSPGGSAESPSPSPSRMVTVAAVSVEGYWSVTWTKKTSSGSAMPSATVGIVTLRLVGPPGSKENVDGEASP